MEALDRLNKAEKEIFEYFGFQMDWAVFPIDDRREYYWKIDGDNVIYAESIEQIEDEHSGNYYQDSLLNHRHYGGKAEYAGVDFTMLMADTHTDGNKFLAIYDNSKKIN